MSTVMLHLPVSLRGLYQAGREHDLVRNDWAVDDGYLVHSLFTRLFGDAAPRPFDIQPAASDLGDRLSVLAYAGQDHRGLRALAAADATARAAIAWDGAASKPMPSLASGQAVGFRVRVCPVVRVGRQHPVFAPGAEVDPYLSELQKRLAAAGLTDGPEQAAARQHILAGLPSREDVYRDWLAARLAPAAELRSARLVAMRDARLWRKGQPGAGAASRMHGHDRPHRAGRSPIGRRDAVFEGELQVHDPAAFAALLARGVGRHRAFGFGMLLLRPASSA